jgi:nitrate/nitrite-specific signal transduction histidine kinase
MTNQFHQQITSVLFSLADKDERAERIGAQLLIQGQPGQGTGIFITIQRERTS